MSNSFSRRPDRTFSLKPLRFSDLLRASRNLVLALLLGTCASLEAGKSAWELMSERPTYAPAPAVPAEARSNRWTGSGIFNLYLWADGRVKQVQLSRSTGHAALDKAALDALNKWRYGPGAAGRVVVQLSFDGKWTWH